MKKRKIKPKRATLPDLVKVMARLRGPNGCPWDKKQNHQTLVRYLREESEELFTAIENGDDENIREELGDVFLQILFHAQIGAERKAFDIYEVLGELKDKLVRRHPHVFARKKGDENLTSDDVKARWKKIKEREKARRNTSKNKLKK